jgi:hypothetical protein
MLMKGVIAFSDHTALLQTFSHEWNSNPEYLYSCQKGVQWHGGGGWGKAFSHEWTDNPSCLFKPDPTIPIGFAMKKEDKWDYLKPL